MLSYMRTRSNKWVNSLTLRSKLVAVIFPFSGLLVAVSCQNQDSTPKELSALTAPTDTGSDAGTPGVKGCERKLPGPSMVRLESPDKKTKYCMDSTEVSWGQYQEFLEDIGSTIPWQPEECAEINSWFAPQADTCKPDDIPHSTDDPNTPAQCLDWCDAAAYCNWAGKRLCGKIGGGALTFEEANDASKSEWYNACSIAGTQKFAYGNTKDDDKCNDSFTASINAKNCHSDVAPSNQILNLSGGVNEWENGYSKGFYFLRGDNGTTDPKMQCDSILSQVPDQYFRYSGIRCCADD